MVSVVVVSVVVVSVVVVQLNLDLVQFSKSIAGSQLFRFLLVLTPGSGEVMLPDHCHDAEVLGMVRSLFFYQLIVGWLAVKLLRVLLQARLEILIVVVGHRGVDFR